MPQPIAGLSDRDVSRQQQSQERAVEHGIVIGDDQHPPAMQLRDVPLDPNSEQSLEKKY
jgi:hypothetical protein